MIVEVTPVVPASTAPAGRKGIRDSNTKGNEVRGSQRGGHGKYSNEIKSKAFYLDGLFMDMLEIEIC